MTATKDGTAWAHKSKTTLPESTTIVGNQRLINQLNTIFRNAKCGIQYRPLSRNNLKFWVVAFPVRHWVKLLLPILLMLRQENAGNVLIDVNIYIDVLIPEGFLLAVSLPVSEWRYFATYVSIGCSLCLVNLCMPLICCLNTTGFATRRPTICVAARRYGGDGRATPVLSLILRIAVIQPVDNRTAVVVTC